MVIKSQGGDGVNKNTEDYAYRTLILYNPDLVGKVIGQQMIGDGESIFYLSDGRRMRFDYFNQRGFYLRKRECSEEQLTNEEWIKEFSKKLKRKLLLRSISQKELANRLGVSEHTISRYVNGHRQPTHVMIREICKILKCDISELTNFDYLL